MPTRFTKRLLTHLSHPTYEPVDVRELSRDLGIEKDDFEDFALAVKELHKKDQVVWGDDQIVSLPPMGGELVGTFRKNPKGFGFIIPRHTNAHGDLFVPPGNTIDAVSGDLVVAEVQRKRGRGGPPGASPYIGQIIEVLERARTSIAGELRMQGNQWIVYPDGKTITDPIIVRDAKAKNAKAGDKVIVEILSYPEGNALGQGVITRVLGKSGEPSVETQAVIEAFDLPGDFPSLCFDQAREESQFFEEDMRQIEKGNQLDPKVRIDLRNDFIVTIDPPDAKDYDDAISIEKLKNVTGGGPGYRLGIHIADVSHYVFQDSALDREASDRCNSVYLPRLVIPMLPEILSNGICSLQEGVPRYTKSAWIEYDMQGKVRATKFAQAMIKSAKRMTYLEAQALIDGKSDEEAAQHAKAEPIYTPQLRETLGHMNDLSRIIRARRKKQGMIHLDLPDVELIFDDTGRVIDAEPEDDAYTHTLIEMFMVEANEAVARLFEQLGVPILRRTHPEPVPGNMEQLRDFVKVAGYRIPKNPTREELQTLLESTHGKPAAAAVHFAVLRTLTRAEYSPALIGHFALASDAYAHFTSPIRRYADLLVHRALLHFLELTANGSTPPKTDGAWKALGRKLRDLEDMPDEQALTVLGHQCNRREDNAESAERDLRAFLVLQFLEQFIGDAFPGIVTGVTGAGVFIRLDKYLAEGLCKSEDIPAPSVNGKTVKFPRWQFERERGSLVERTSGRSYSLGDRVSVKIADIKLSGRRMELVIEDTGTRDVGKTVKPKEHRDEIEIGPGRTGAQKRSQRSKSRDKRKSDFRSDKKGKGKRQ